MQTKNIRITISLLLAVLFLCLTACSAGSGQNTTGTADPEASDEVVGLLFVDCICRFHGEFRRIY